MPGRVSSPLFVGRRAELEVLRDVLDRAQRGAGEVVMIEADPGMGKSRLVAELGDVAQTRMARMVVGECLPLGDSDIPYAPVARILRSLLRDGVLHVEEPGTVARDELIRLLPELSAAPENSPTRSDERSAAPGRLFEQLLALLVALAEPHPIVVVVEDVHWADPSTRDLLTFLARGIRRERLTLVLTFRGGEIHRTHPARRFLYEIERSGQAIRLELRGFDRDEVREQVSAILEQEPPPELLRGLFDRGEGNPFFTEELLAVVPGPGAPLPRSLRDAMLYRVDDSSPQVRDILRIAAVAGREIDHRRLQEVASLEPGDLLDGVRDAVALHLLVENPRTGGYAFRHALLREAVYQDLLAEERRALHLSLARALGARLDSSEESNGPAELAHHWYAARQWPEAFAAALRAAVEAAALHAPAESLAQYERALELWDRIDSTRAELSRIEITQRASEVALLSGAVDRAIELARETLGQLGPEDRVALALAHERLGRYLWVAGHGEQALPEYRRAVEIMPVSRSREHALVLASEAQALMLSSFWDLSERRCEEALQAASIAGADDIRANLLNTICINLANRGEFDQASDRAREALALARRLNLVEEVGRAHVNGSEALDQGGRLEQSIALAREGLRTARTLGADRRYGDFLRAEIARRQIRTGAWTEAERALAGLLETVAGGVNGALVHLGLAELRAERGEGQAALDAIVAAERRIPHERSSIWLAPLAAARATVHLWDGDPEAAAATVDRCLAQFDRGEFVFHTARLHELGIRAHADLRAVVAAETAGARQHSERAEALLARLDRVLARVPGSRHPRVRADRAGCVAELRRITASDPSAWEQAELLSGEINDVHKVAYAQWRRAEALVQLDRDHRHAGDLAQRARSSAEALGARPLAQAVLGLIRGARLEDQHVPAVSAGKPFDLTPRESEVLDLLADGMSNREIADVLVISHRTAGVHVSRILTKLSVTNRASAAVVASRLRQGGEDRSS